jgi:hypothetical protein
MKTNIHFSVLLAIYLSERNMCRMYDVRKNKTRMYVYILCMYGCMDGWMDG